MPDIVLTYAGYHVELENLKLGECTIGVPEMFGVPIAAESFAYIKVTDGVGALVAAHK